MHSISAALASAFRFQPLAFRAALLSSLVVGAAATAHAQTVPVKLINLSVRANAGTGANALSTGFVIGGLGSKQVLLRAVGPALAKFGVTGFNPTPLLELFNSSGYQIAENAGWGGTTVLTTLFAQVGAFPLPSTSADAALTTVLANGAYTTTVTGGSGIALAELYDEDPAAAATRLLNLSGRAPVGAGAGALIAGFIVAGAGSEKVLLRGVGPTLGAFGVTGTLAAPVLTLTDATGRVLATNSGWNGDPNIAAAAAAAGAFPLAAGSTDSAIVTTLTAGSYSVQVSGANGASGLAMVEVYETH